MRQYTEVLSLLRNPIVDEVGERLGGMKNGVACGKLGQVVQIVQLANDLPLSRLNESKGIMKQTIPFGRP